MPYNFVLENLTISMSKEEYWLLEPDRIPDQIYELGKKEPCYGLPFMTKNKEEFRVFSPTIASIFVYPDINELFWNSNSKSIPVKQLLNSYIQAYKRGYDEG